MHAATAIRLRDGQDGRYADGPQIRRELDAALVNRVANLATVHLAIAYHGQPLDWSAAFPSEDTGVVVLSNGYDACAVFASTADRVWQGHTIFGPTCRGRSAIETGKAIIAWMLPHADLIWGATPIGNRAARWFNRQIGGRPAGFDHYDVEGDVELFNFGSTH
ncbi:hypothetical protein [Sphingomonas sp. S-NIH.Pt15_0812]|uniref:hypothetical protein n=1 Tax=Sphingomonas sp. S-NIH.Pt15_0812 TaxID=1920129 RepID=UPI000F7E01EA|nr:hypothetical protein [Sphingomonas sp. S-NIH.Pt15_0812]RSU53995.1 hypothetical protein BRX43_03175 [Sphingomonas sp. S-NIH.Pt15_0812]